MTEFNQFLSGALMAVCWASSVFFLKFWRRTGDPFFNIFSLAFCLLGFERFLLLFLRMKAEAQPWIYLVRLLAYLMILAAIAHKNRLHLKIKS